MNSLQPARRKPAEILSQTFGTKIILQYLITLVFLVPIACFSQGPIEVESYEDGEKPTGLSEIWHEATGSSGIEEASKAYLREEFQPLQSAGSTGLKSGAFWSRFALKNTAETPLTLYIEYVDHQLIELQAFARYIKGDEGFLPITSLSLNSPFYEREINHNRFAFPINIPAGETIELMVKFSSDKMGFIFPSMRIWDPGSFHKSRTLELSLMAFLAGGFFLMSIISLACGIYTRDKIYYTYSAYALLKIIVWCTLIGYTHQYFIVERFHWNYMAVSGALAIFCGVVYSRMFLQTRTHTPWMDHLLKLMMANAIFLLSCALFKLVALSIISVTIALLLYPVISIAAYVRWRQGSTEAAIFGLAWGLLVFGLVVQALRDIGYVEHNFTNYYWPPVASFIEMLAIMLATFMKVHRLDIQKEHAERQYTQQLERSKLELEQLVRERTRELESAKSLAEREARVDLLTGIHNRRSFFIQAENRIKLAKRKGFLVSLLMFDIDHFKSINDNYGHAIGDDALRAFSEVIASRTRDIDVFGRIGGEEFALLLISGPKDGMDTAQRLKLEIEQISIETPEGPLLFTASIGVAYLGEESDIEILMHNADKAMYRAKKQGRNQVVEYACPVI